MENILSNVTNTVNCDSTYKKRLKSGDIKEYKRKNYLRQNITLNFVDETAKHNFGEHLEKARKILHPATTSCVLLAGLKCIIEDSKVCNFLLVFHRALIFSKIRLESHR